MRKAQGLPIEMIILIALALLVLVVVGAFFISGFGQATSGVQVVEKDQAECSAMCQGLITTAFNYNDCDDLKDVQRAKDYVLDSEGFSCSESYGLCTVTLRNGQTCRIGE